MATRQSFGTRARDTDRNDTCQVLDTALAEGQLTMEEHRSRVSAATHATTLGELQALVADLQTTNAPVQLPTLKSPMLPHRRSAFIGIAMLVAAVLLGIGIGYGLYGNTSSPLNFTSDPGAKPDGVTPIVLTPPKQLHSLGGLTGLFEQMRKRFGDTNGYDLTVYPDHASLQREDPNEPRRVLYYSYSGGWGDSTSDTSKDSDDVLVDLSAFDIPKVVGILRGAPETLGIDPKDVDDVYLIIGPSDNPMTPGELTLSIHVHSELAGSGYIEIGADGTEKRITYPSN